jgi:predicted nucleotidyltransferase
MPAAEELESYKKTLRRREAEERDAVARRRDRAWILARRAAELLKTGYGATRVVLFGSLASGERFHLRSDVDVAAWGIPRDDTFRAVGELLSLDSDIEINLVDVSICRPSLLTRIEREGTEL